MSIYATDPATYPDVIGALRAFAPEMPERVHRSGRFVDTPASSGRVRGGDRLVITGLGAPLDGAVAVEDEGLIALTGLAKVDVGGRSADEASAAILAELVRAGRPPGALRVARVEARPARVLVAGDVPRVVELAAGPLTPTLIAAGAPDGARAWVWRELADGFARFEGADLADGALADGDIVVVAAGG